MNGRIKKGNCWGCCPEHLHLFIGPGCLEPQQSHKAIFVGALRQISLVVGVFLGWKLYHEPVSKTRLLGVVGIILGSLLTLVAK
jgi:hypothetical protein